MKENGVEVTWIPTCQEMDNICEYLDFATREPK